MLQELLALLPKDAPSGVVWISLAIASAGFVLWLLAARFSRFAVTLLTVAGGAAIGMQLPRWFGWAIDGAGPAVAAAVVLGVTGYVLHGLWTGLGLGIASAFWVTLICWFCLRDGATWTWPQMTDITNLAAYAGALWEQLPGPMQRILPFGVAASLITGLAMAIMWPRLTMAIAWSLVGLTMMVVGGATAANYGQPELFAHVPAAAAVQVAILGGVLGVGAAIQWKLAPEKRRKASSADAHKQKPAETTT